MVLSLSQIPGARKKGVVLISSEDDFKKLDAYLINDTVCIDGPAGVVFKLAKLICEKYKVAVKVVSVESTPRLLAPVPYRKGQCSPGSEDIQVINSPIQEIVGEGRAEAVKFKDGKALGVCLVILVDKAMPDLSPKQVEAGQLPQLLVELGIKGTQTVLNLTRQSLASAISQKGQNVKIEFPETNYYLPLINALLNIEVKNLQDCLAAFVQAEALANHQAASSGLFINSLGGLLNQGLATLICEEILAALAVLNQEHPKEGEGFIPDKILRSLGLQLVDGRICGIAVILGPAKDEQSAVELIRDFQSKSIVSFLAGNINGNTFKQQLQNQGVQLGLENYIVALGDDYLSAIYAVNFAVRAPLIYGGNKPGEWGQIADYIRNRVPAFVLLLSHVDELLVATGLGALAFGLPIITDLEVPQLGKIDTTLFEALVTEQDYRKLPSKCILTRGIKVKMSQVPVPVPYAAAFEGERVRKEQLGVEFGGKSSAAIEFLNSCDEASITDGSVELIGPDIDQLPAGSKSLPLAIAVDVFGRKMQKDFEPILERQIHRFINYGMGLMHMGQRDMVWIRISQDAYSKGFRLAHLGIILHAMLHSEYSAIVDKVQVKLYTNQEDVAKVSLQAQGIYNQRDERLAGMTDESVDTFYSCLLCQSFAPNHVCVVTPERLGLCGAYSWLDAKASFEIIPSGPNQPILKGNLLDERLGQWDNINSFVQQKSNQSIDAVSMYSLMDGPQSSCGCFECIVAIVPEANGVMLVHRDYSGATPSGMSFTTLAGSVSGGVQTPGFLGVGKLYILSKKFISAEGGLSRVVWMPKELKEILGDKLKSRAQEIGQEDLLDKIADESVATSSEELLAFLKQVAHPALTMDPII
jgi:acetyl-CoA synthase